MKIDGAISLSLDKRKSEWESLKKDVEENLDIPYKEFICGSGKILEESEYDYIDDHDISLTAFTDSWGYSRPKYETHHYNARVCHSKMAEYALDKGWEYTLFLEDDAYFTDRFKNIWNNENVKKYLDENNPDIIYLGWWHGEEDDEWNTEIEDNYNHFEKIGLVRIASDIGGLHGVILSSRVLEIIKLLPHNNPVDKQLNGFNKILKSYLIAPKIIHVKSIYSECEGYIPGRKKL